MLPFLAIKTALGSIPPAAYKAVAVILIVAGAYYYAYTNGVKAERKVWLDIQAAQQMKDKTDEVKSAEIKTETVIRYIDRVQTITKNIEVVREKIKLVPVDTCVVPIEFIRLHDEAVEANRNAIGGSEVPQ